MTEPQKLNRFTTSALVQRLRDRNSTMTKADAELAVARVFDALETSIQADPHVRISGFGTFKVKQRQERNGRNPRTGETVKIAAKKVVVFSPAKSA